MRRVVIAGLIALSGLVGFSAPAVAAYCVTIENVPPPTDHHVCLPI